MNLKKKILNKNISKLYIKDICGGSWDYRKSTHKEYEEFFLFHEVRRNSSVNSLVWAKCTWNDRKQTQIENNSKYLRADC